jgi:hypothetical protein
MKTNKAIITKLTKTHLIKNQLTKTKGTHKTKRKKIHRTQRIQIILSGSPSVKQKNLKIQRI